MIWKYITQDLVYLSLKLSLPLIAYLIVEIPLYIARESMKKWLFRTTVILTTLSLLITSGILIVDDYNMKKDKEKNEDHSISLARIRAGQGDDKSLHDFNDMLRALIDKQAAQDSEKFMDDLKSSLPEKIKERKTIDQNNAKIASEYKVRWLPICNLILTEIDSRMDKLKNDGIVVNIEKVECPVVDINKNISFKQVRTYTFNDGSQLCIEQYPAWINSSHNFGFQFIFKLANHSYEGLVSFQFTPEQSNVNNALKNKLHFDDYSSKIIDPISDKALLDIIVTAINKSVTYSTVESQSAKGE